MGLFSLELRMSAVQGSVLGLHSAARKGRHPALVVTGKCVFLLAEQEAQRGSVEGEGPR